MTKLVCGGVYKKEANGREYTALCTSVVVHANGLRQGKLEVYGFATERVEEDSDELNLYTLVAGPAPLEKAIKRRKAS